MYEGTDRRPGDRDVANVNKLKSCRAVVLLMEKAVGRVDWSEEHDKVPDDNYPRREEIDRVVQIFPRGYSWYG